MFWRYLLSLWILCPLATYADLSIPTQLSSSDRISALEILGFGTAGKNATNPYPLGGYLGVEMGFGMERLELENLSQLGTTSQEQNELLFPTFSFGKGLYGNIDLFFYFTPFLESISLSRFGGFLRWGFFQSKVWPTSLSLLVHAGNTNIDNKITTETYSYSFIGSYQLWDFALYAGIGELISKGEFIGGASGVTDTGNTENEKVQKVFSIFGVSYLWQPYSITLELHHAHSSVIHLKLGLRF